MLLNFRLFSRIFYAFFLLVLIILGGTIGYITVEGWSVSEAFYMTIITVSTVGFNEVRELSQNGQLFTSFLIITSFGTFAYAVTSITSYLVGGEYKKYFKEYKQLQVIDKLNNHVIVCGHGRVGKQASIEVAAHEHDYVIVENKQEIISEFISEKFMYYIQGDATEDENLLKAGIKRAKALITTLPKDSDNLYVVLTAREINPDLLIISRASNSASVKKLKIAGADNIIMPDTVGGSHMASLVVTPDVTEFLDHISIQGDAEINLEELTFNNLPEDYKYKNIGELNARKITGCNIIGYKSPEGEYIINPTEETTVIPGSKLFVLGRPDQIKKLNELFGV